MDTETPRVDSESTDPARQAISEAETVLDDLLDVVRGQAEGILDAARAEASAQEAAILAAARAEAAQIVARAEAEAAEVIAAARRRLEEAMALLADAVPAAVDVADDVAPSSTSDVSVPGEPAAVPTATDVPEATAPVEPAAAAEAVEAVDERVPAPAEVDPDALRVLARELGSDACREVVDTFLVELTSQLDYLTAAALGDDEDPKKVGRTLHNLSSGCATVGAFGVAKLCNLATAEDLADHIDQLVDRGETVRSEVQRLVAAGLLD